MTAKTEFKSWGTKTESPGKSEPKADPIPQGDIIIRDRFGRIVHRIPARESTPKVETEPELNTTPEPEPEISNTLLVDSAEISEPEPDYEEIRRKSWESIPSLSLDEKDELDDHFSDRSAVNGKLDSDARIPTEITPRDFACYKFGRESDAGDSASYDQGHTSGFKAGYEALAGELFRDLKELIDLVLSESPDIELGTVKTAFRLASSLNIEYLKQFQTLDHGGIIEYE